MSNQTTETLTFPKDVACLFLKETTNPRKQDFLFNKAFVVALHFKGLLLLLALLLLLLFPF